MFSKVCAVDRDREKKNIYVCVSCGIMKMSNTIRVKNDQVQKGMFRLRYTLYATTNICQSIPRHAVLKRVWFNLDGICAPFVPSARYVNVTSM